MFFQSNYLIPRYFNLIEKEILNTYKKLNKNNKLLFMNSLISNKIKLPIYIEKIKKAKDKKIKDQQIDFKTAVKDQKLFLKYLHY